MTEAIVRALKRNDVDDVWRVKRKHMVRAKSLMVAQETIVLDEFLPSKRTS